MKKHIAGTAEREALLSAIAAVPVDEGLCSSVLWAEMAAGGSDLEVQTLLPNYYLGHNMKNHNTQQQIIGRQFHQLSRKAKNESKKKKFQCS